MVYADPSLAAGDIVKAVHIQDLRAGMNAGLHHSSRHARVRAGPGAPREYDVKSVKTGATPDQLGFTANAKGFAYLDQGVGGMLSGPQCPTTDHGHGIPAQLTSPPANCNPNASWAAFAKQFDGKFRVPTVRNVDMRPYPTFVKAYMHNGYLKSLKEVVHFYNTRDRFAASSCAAGTEKVTCWPPPEVAANLDKTVGNLGLSDKEEDQIVAFLRALTDGFKSP